MPGLEVQRLEEENKVLLEVQSETHDALNAAWQDLDEAQAREKQVRNALPSDQMQPRRCQWSRRRPTSHRERGVCS
jgi:hypothetical protein